MGCQAVLHLQENQDKPKASSQIELLSLETSLGQIMQLTWLRKNVSLRFQTQNITENYIDYGRFNFLTVVPRLTYIDTTSGASEEAPRGRERGKRTNSSAFRRTRKARKTKRQPVEFPDIRSKLGSGRKSWESPTSVPNSITDRFALHN
ncbi:hypothetical protein EVAR_82436_1 [Eumeta japonica]|uniref:Uncharacterized protein n=1 Tax=Eumeta variegata TaxID=151549 RepID=A0A4C1YG23_EUMVA|nr:hypothetical protein EVAR_82436_1 [Eumeta japonica]